MVNFRSRLFSNQKQLFYITLTVKEMKTIVSMYFMAWYNHDHLLTHEFSVVYCFFKVQ